MEARTTLDRIDIDTSTGRISVRLSKQILNGAAVMASEPHRITVEPLADKQHLDTLDDLFVAIGDHLAQMGYPPVNDADMAKIKMFAAAAAVDGYSPVLPG